MIDKIMKKIEEEIKRRESSVDPLISKNNSFKNSNKQKNLQNSKFYIFAKNTAKMMEKKGLYRLVNFIKNRVDIKQYNVVYTLEDFAHHYDEAFIDNAYNLILERKPDEAGKSIYLAQLRAGDKSKTEILTSLYYSKEAKENNIVILGMRKRYLISLVYKVPVLGYIAKIIVNIIFFPKLLKRINHHETKSILERDKNHVIISQLQQKIDTITKDINIIRKDINKSQDSLFKIELKLSTKADLKDFKEYLKTVEYAKEYMKESQLNMQKLIDQAKESLSTTMKNPLLEGLEEEDKHKFDALYVEFEDKFRGERGAIKKRLNIYLPYLKALPFEPQESEVLDVGCGRGEWLELLKENEYKAYGIDLNKIMVTTAQALNLDVKAIDVIEHLKSLHDNSLNIITGFHIIEHLPFEVLMRLYEESYRVLKKGGMIIFETPNPENILVASHYFYTDPTHINPLVPVTTEFLVQQNGFKKTEIKRLHKYSQYNSLVLENEFMEKHFNSEMDYAIIGYKI